MITLTKVPYYFSTFLLRLCQKIRISLYRTFDNAKISGVLIRRQPVVLIGKGEIEFHGIVEVGVFPSPGFLTSYAHIEARKFNSKITIGNGTKINNNFCAIAEYSSISIGENCRIGHNVELLDSDFHGVEIEDRDISKQEWCKPIVIGNNVFLGAHSKILKGVSIGDGAVVANSSVVTKDVRAYTLVGGSPARFIRTLDGYSES